jgi:molybdopterin molybdotransferase
MPEFFNVADLSQVFTYISDFAPVGTEIVALVETPGRILAEDVVSDIDLPDFSRATMDGYAVCGASTFGASEGNPAYLTVKGAIPMGVAPNEPIGPGQAVRISTGGMLPPGADSIVMIEHTEAIDEATIEVYRSVAPGQYVVEIGEDIKKGEVMLTRGRRIRPQETGLLAALGKSSVQVYQKPRVGIISTGDEIVAVDTVPDTGQVRDVNTFTLAGLIRETGAQPLIFGIVRDDYQALFQVCSLALEQSDMVLISGGSSVGTRDFTIEVLSAMPEAGIRVHGISISPGKPTILASVQGKPFWGLPGHVVSAMIVFARIVRPFLNHIRGCTEPLKEWKIPAILSRNVASAQGRVDFVRVRLYHRDNRLMAEPILGKSGLIHTMVKADGLIEIDMNTEGLYEGAPVEVIPF